MPFGPAPRSRSPRRPIAGSRLLRHDSHRHGARSQRQRHERIAQPLHQIEVQQIVAGFDGRLQVSVRHAMPAGRHVDVSIAAYRQGSAFVGADGEVAR